MNINGNIEDKNFESADDWGDAFDSVTESRLHQNLHIKCAEMRLQNVVLKKRDFKKASISFLR